MNYHCPQGHVSVLNAAMAPNVRCALCGSPLVAEEDLFTKRIFVSPQAKRELETWLDD